MLKLYFSKAYTESEIPYSVRADKTIPMYQYETLIEKPAMLNYEEFKYEVHVVRRGKQDLKLQAYKLERCELLTRFGWAIYEDRNNKLTLLDRNSERFLELVKDAQIRKVHIGNERSN